MKKLLILLVVISFGISEAKFASDSLYGTTRVIAGKTTYTGTAALQVSGNIKIRCRS